MSGSRVDLRRQRGVAVITALLLTTLAITIVASLFWQQQVQVRSIENQQLQSKKQEVLRGALDYARLILREDRKGGEIDFLGEAWSVPLQDTRLDQYVENGRTDADASDATLSGTIVDAQSLFNLANLCCDAGLPNKGEIIAFATLLTNAGVDPKLAQATADMMQKAQKAKMAVQTAGAAPGAQPMDLTQVDDLLAVPGFTPEILDRVKAWLIVLPTRTPLNINTAPAEVLAAKIDKLSLAEAKVVVAERERAYFRDNKHFVTLGRTLTPVPDTTGLDIKTNFFLVNGKVRLSRASLEVQSLIDRTDGTPGGTKIVWMREK